MYGPYHVGCESGYGLLGVERYGVASDDADLRIPERFQQSLQGIPAAEDVVGIENYDNLSLLGIQEAVDRRILPFSLLLNDEFESGIFGNQVTS